MNYLMKRMLSLQHWQLFLLLFINTWKLPAPFALVTPVVSATTGFLWLYAVVIYGAEKAKQRNVLYSINLTFFKLNLLILIILFISLTAISNYELEVPKLIIQSCTIYSVMGSFYSLAAAAKTITSLTQERDVAFKDYFLVLLLMCLFLVGVWVIQPKVKELMA